MTREERQQSLTNARRACELLASFAANDDQSLFLKQSKRKYIAALLVEFKRLDDKEKLQAAQGNHGAKGGRPRKAKETEEK